MLARRPGIKYSMLVQPQFSLLVILMGLVVMLVPLAYASPPDPVWIGGIYDNADYDDVVSAVSFSDSNLNRVAPEVAGLVPTFGFAQLAETLHPAAAGFSAFSIRAPPLA